MNADSSPAPRSLAAAIDRAEQRLRAAQLAHGHGADNAGDEAAWLVLAALGLSPVGAADPARSVTAREWQAVESLLCERIEQRRPLAYITGRAWFAGLEFEVDPRALVPRSPLAELISGRFEPWLTSRRVRRILDIGTGCGCIAVACAFAFPDASIDATDNDPAALALAETNVARHGVADRVALHQADVYQGLPPGRRYDLIISNPPYVDAAAMARLPAEYRHEPAAALAAGVEGLDVVERILLGAAGRVRDDGLLVVEVGQGAARLEQRFPSTPFVWLALETGDVDVFALPARDLPGRGDPSPA